MKSTTRGDMQIVAHRDNPWTFQVKSRTRKGHHLVDLQAYEKNGECACEHFRFTCLSVWKVTHTPQDCGEHATRCAHIIACRELLLNDCLARLERQLSEAHALRAPRQEKGVFGKIGKTEMAGWLAKGL